MPSPLDIAPVFVVGSARSGTVFVGQVLKRHPRIHCTIEHPRPFRLATRLAMAPPADPAAAVDEIRLAYQVAWSRRPAVCWRCAPDCRDPAGRRRFALRSCTAGAQIERYADKSHQHVLNVDLVDAAYPAARYLHVVRDGRDVVTSMLRHPGVLSWFTEEHIHEGSAWPHRWFGVESAAHYREWSGWPLERKCALRWASWVRAGRAAGARVGADRWLDVRYEELTAAPVEVGRRVFSFAGVAPHDPAVAAARRDSVGGWQEKLTPSQHANIADVVGPELEALGYEPAG